MRSVRVLRNILTNYLRFFSAGVIGFVLTPLMVHALGDGGYGLWVTIFSLTGYFGLIDQGIRPSLVRYVSRDHTRGDREGLSRTLSSATVLYAAAGLVVFALTAIVALTCDRWFHLNPAQVATARGVVILSGSSLALGLPLGVFGAALSGLQRYDVANTIGIGINVVRAIAFVVVLRFHGGLLGLAWAALVTNLLGHVLSVVALMRLLPGVPITPRFVDRAHLGLIGSYSGFAFIGALAASIAFQTDALVITTFIGAAFVTPFALAAGLVDNARWLVQSAAHVLSPAASELDTLGERDKLHAMVLAGSKYSILVSWPVLLGLIVFGDNLIRTWVGERYVTVEPLARVLSAHGPSASAAQILILLAIPTMIALPQTSAASILYGVGKHRGVVALSILNALLNLGLSILWVGPFGIAGVALGTAVPLAIVAGIATMIYTCRALDLSIARYAWDGFVRPALCVLAFLVPALFLQWRFEPVGWGPLAAVCIGSWLIFALVGWCLALAPDERRRWGRMVPGLFRGAVAPVGGSSP
jgi:O-antigen/teichoic acid export membrane protein